MYVFIYLNHKDGVVKEKEKKKKLKKRQQFPALSSMLIFMRASN